MSNPYNLPVLNVISGFHSSDLIISSSIIYFTKIECQSIIRQAFANQHSITVFEWDDDRCCYRIEYRTRPYEYKPEANDFLCHLRKNAVSRAVSIALNKFPHNLPEPNLEIEPPSLTPQWCEFEIRLVWNENTNSIYMICSPLLGDYVSFNIISSNVYAYAAKKYMMILGLMSGLTQGYCLEVCDVCKRYGIPTQTNVTCKCYNSAVSYVREYLTRDFV